MGDLKASVRAALGETKNDASVEGVVRRAVASGFVARVRLYGFMD